MSLALHTRDRSITFTWLKTVGNSVYRGKDEAVWTGRLGRHFETLWGAGDSSCPVFGLTHSSYRLSPTFSPECVVTSLNDKSIYSFLSLPPDILSTYDDFFRRKHFTSCTERALALTQLQQSHTFPPDCYCSSIFVLISRYIINPHTASDSLTY